MIVLYVLEGCPYCLNSLRLLKQYKIKHKAILVPYEKKDYYKKQNKMDTFPQIFMKINKDQFATIGGNSNLEELLDLCKTIKNSNYSLSTITNLYENIYGKK